MTHEENENRSALWDRAEALVYKALALEERLREVRSAAHWAFKEGEVETGRAWNRKARALKGQLSQTQAEESRLRDQLHTMP